MNPEQRRVRELVYATFAEQGRAPSPAELARRTDASRSDTERILGELADAHALVLTRDGDAIRMAHPFSADPMAFVVTPRDGFDDRRWWGGCAWDSFGISAALGLEVQIDTACPQCGTHLSYAAGPATAPPAELVVRFPRPAAQWWDDVVGTCTMIRTFCTHEHAATWDAQHGGGGYLAPATSVWELAGPWYGDRLDADFRPHTREHNQGLLAACGLHGSFWQLP